MRKLIKEKYGTGRGGQRGGMWRRRPPEGRKHPEEPGSTSHRGGETAGKSEGRLGRFPLPPARLPVTAPGQAAPHRPRQTPRRDPQARLPPPPPRPAPARRAPLPIFGAHTLQGAERSGRASLGGRTPAREAEACGPPPEPARGSLRPSRRGPRFRPPCSSPPRRLPSPHRTAAPPDPPSSFWRQTVALVAAAAT